MAQVIKRNFSKRICFIHAGEKIQQNNLGRAPESGLGNLIILSLQSWFSPKVSVDQRSNWTDVWMKKGAEK